MPADVSVAVAGEVTGALVDHDDVELGSNVTEQQELKDCGVPGAAAVSRVLPDPGTYDMRACTANDAGEPRQEGGKLSVY